MRWSKVVSEIFCALLETMDDHLSYLVLHVHEEGTLRLRNELTKWTSWPERLEMNGKYICRVEWFGSLGLVLHL